MTQQAEHQQYEIGVKAVIIHDNELLLLKRRDHSVWEVPGGRIHQGETIIDTIHREVPEELPGAEVIEISRLLHAEQQDFVLPNGNRLMLLFYAVDVALPAVIRHSDEHTAISFVSNDDISDYVTQAPILRAATLGFSEGGQSL